MVWCSGAVVLSYKSARAVLEAYSINPIQYWLWLTILGGILFGAIRSTVSIW